MRPLSYAAVVAAATIASQSAIAQAPAMGANNPVRPVAVGATTSDYRTITYPTAAPMPSGPAPTTSVMPTTGPYATPAATVPIGVAPAPGAIPNITPMSGSFTPTVVPLTTLPPAVIPAVPASSVPQPSMPVYLPTPAPPTLPSVGGPLYEPVVARVTPWLGVEGLAWWVKGKSLPPIFTTSPPGTSVDQAGVLGTMGTTTVYGGDDPFENPRWGGRIRAGFWVNHGDHAFGLEGSFFRLSGASSGSSVSGNGYPIYARPFVNAQGFNDAELISYPDRLVGSATANYEASSLSGADALLRKPLICDPCNPCAPRLDLLMGYRWLQYSESLSIAEYLQPTGPAFATGTNITVMDHFQVRNEFHGGTLGLSYGGRNGQFTYDLIGRASFGYLNRQVTINGSTLVTVPGAAPSLSPGGLLAQQSNIGMYDDGKWTVIPEAEFRIGYDLTSSLRLTAGYSVLMLNDFYRVGNVIDTTVNTTLIPGSAGPVTGPARPAYNPSGGGIWVHGLNFGAELRF